MRSGTRGRRAPPYPLCRTQQQQLPQLLQPPQQHPHPQLLLQLQPQPQLHPQLFPFPPPQPQQQMRMMIRMIQINPESLFHMVCHLTYQSGTSYVGSGQNAA